MLRQQKKPSGSEGLCWAKVMLYNVCLTQAKQTHLPLLRAARLTSTLGEQHNDVHGLIGQANEILC